MSKSVTATTSADGEPGGRSLQDNPGAVTRAGRGSGQQAAIRAERVARWLQERMRLGVLSFPLTPFTKDGAGIDVAAYRRHLRRQIDAGPAALFPCCGTGEYFSLSEDEYAELVGVAVAEAGGQLPVVAGVGYGWSQAARFAAIADAAGADAALVLPHYLVEAPQHGLVEQIRQLALRTDLPLIPYQRGQVKYTMDSLTRLIDIPNVIGLKDGHSDHVQLQCLRLAAPPEFLFINGALTAEIQARPYRSVGIAAYSSAVHCFAPEISGDFFRAFRDGDDDRMNVLLGEFYSPFVALRDRQPGYAVSLVKAAAGMRGESLGPVRAPLADPVGVDRSDLEALVRRGLDLVGADL